MPHVSIVIPTCNRPELLARALSSVLTQTYQEFEVIIVDDGTERHAMRIAAEANDPRIRVIEHKKPLRGGSATRNTGIKTAQGELIAFLDDDDEWLPEKLLLQVSALDAVSSDVGFCVTGARVMSEKEEHNNTVEEGVHDFGESALIRLNGFLTTTLVIRREVFDRIGYFDESFPSHQEAELMVRITREYKGIGITRPLVRMNMFAHEHIGGSSSRRIEGRLMFLAKHAQLFASRPRVHARHLFTLGIWYRDAGRYQEARAAYLTAWRLSGNLRYLAHALALMLPFRTQKVVPLNQARSEQPQQD